MAIQDLLLGWDRRFLGTYLQQSTVTYNIIELTAIYLSRIVG